MHKPLIILKPDCMKQKHVGAVIGRFEAAGFRIIGCKLMQLTPALLREHYAHVADKPFYPRLEAFMSSAPVMVMAIAGDYVVETVRAVLGPTDSTKAPKGTIRGDFGTDVTINVVHASDGEESAKVELARFFAPGEIIDPGKTAVLS